MKNMDAHKSAYFAYLYSLGYGAGRPRFGWHDYSLLHTEYDTYPRSCNILAAVNSDISMTMILGQPEECSIYKRQAALL